MKLIINEIKMLIIIIKFSHNYFFSSKRNRNDSINQIHNNYKPTKS